MGGACKVTPLLCQNFSNPYALNGANHHRGRARAFGVHPPALWQGAPLPDQLALLALAVLAAHALEAPADSRHRKAVGRRQLRKGSDDGAEDSQDVE